MEGNLGKPPVVSQDGNQGGSVVVHPTPTTQHTNPHTHIYPQTISSVSTNAQVHPQPITTASVESASIVTLAQSRPSAVDTRTHTQSSFKPPTAQYINTTQATLSSTSQTHTNVTGSDVGAHAPNAHDIERVSSTQGNISAKGTVPIVQPKSSTHAAVENLESHAQSQAQVHTKHHETQVYMPHVSNNSHTRTAYNTADGVQAYAPSALTAPPMSHTAADVFRRGSAGVKSNIQDNNHNSADQIHTGGVTSTIRNQQSYTQKSNTGYGGSHKTAFVATNPILNGNGGNGWNSSGVVTDADAPYGAFPTTHTGHDSNTVTEESASQLQRHTSSPKHTHSTTQIGAGKSVPTHTLGSLAIDQNPPCAQNNDVNGVNNTQHTGSGEEITYETIRHTLRRLLQKQTALEDKLARASGDIKLGQLHTVQAHLAAQMRYFDTTIGDGISGDVRGQAPDDVVVYKGTNQSRAHNNAHTQTQQQPRSVPRRQTVQNNSAPNKTKSVSGGSDQSHECVTGRLGLHDHESVGKLLKGVERLQHTHRRQERRRRQVYRQTRGNNAQTSAEMNLVLDGETTEASTSDESDGGREVGPKGLVRARVGRPSSGGEKLSALETQEYAAKNVNECRHVSRNRRFFRRRAALAWRWSWLEVRIAQLNSHIGTLSEHKSQAHAHNKAQYVPYIRQIEQAGEHGADGAQSQDHTHSLLHTHPHMQQTDSALYQSGHTSSQVEAGTSAYPHTQPTQAPQLTSQYTQITQHNPEVPPEHHPANEAQSITSTDNTVQPPTRKSSMDASAPVTGKKRKSKTATQKPLTSHKDKTVVPKTCGRLREYVLPNPRTLWAENTVGVKGRPEIIFNAMGRDKLARQISAMDSSYHPILSRVVEAVPFLRCSALHPAPALPLASACRGQRENEDASTANLVKLANKSSTGSTAHSKSNSSISVKTNSTSNTKRKPASRTSSTSKVNRKRSSEGKKRDKAGLQRKRTKSTSNISSVELKRRATEGTESTTGTTASTGVLDKNTRRTSSHSNVFKRQKVYDIDDVVIPVTAGMVTKVQAIEFQEIETPSWRQSTLQPTDAGTAADEHYSSEDTSDEAYERRHNARQKIETTRFEAFMKNLHKPRRRRSSHTRKDSQTEKQITENDDDIGTPGTDTANGGNTPANEPKDLASSARENEVKKSDSGQLNSTSTEMGGDTHTNNEKLRNDACIVRLPLLSGSALDSVSIEGSTVGAISTALKEKEKDRSDDTKVVQVKVQQQQQQVQQQSGKRARLCWSPRIFLK